MLVQEMDLKSRLVRVGAAMPRNIQIETRRSGSEYEMGGQATNLHGTGSRVHEDELIGNTRRGRCFREPS